MAGRQRPHALEGEGSRGGRGRGGHGVDERDAELGGAPAHLVEQARDAAGEAARVDEPDVAPLHAHRQPAEGVVALGQSRGRHAVADQRDLPRSHGVEEHLHGAAVEVHAVGDDLDHGLAPTGRRQRRGHRPRLAREHRRHAVEEVGHQRLPAARRVFDQRGQGGAGGARRRRRCGRPRRGSRAAPSPNGSRVGARQLRGPGHLRDGTGPRLQHQLVEQLEVGVDERGRVLRPAPHRRQERSLEVYAGELAVADQRRAGAHTGEQTLRRRGDQGADDRGAAGPVVVGRGGAGAAGVGAELPAAAAVAVDVDQAGEEREAGAPPVGHRGTPVLRRQVGVRTGIQDAVAGDDDGAVGHHAATAAPPSR